ncbi:MAG: tryptophan synthase subunit alpha [Pyrobaculum sp.]
MMMRPSVGVYLIAGWPDADTYKRGLAVVSKYADFFELGVPTSNPKYDGPYIRSAHREVASPVWERPGVATYVMAYWEDYVEAPERLFEKAAELGARGVLAPDLLVDFPEDLELYTRLTREWSLSPVYFLPSKFPHSLARRLASTSPDFVYLGLYAATGIELPVYVERNIKVLRSEAPGVFIVAGFAIDAPEKAVKAVKAGADGVVIGTAFMKKLKNSPEEAAAFLSAVREALKAVEPS